MGFGPAVVLSAAKELWPLLIGTETAFQRLGEYKFFRSFAGGLWVRGHCALRNYAGDCFGMARLQAQAAPTIRETPRAPGVGTCGLFGAIAAASDSSPDFSSPRKMQLAERGGFELHFGSSRFSMTSCDSRSQSVTFISICRVIFNFHHPMFLDRW